MNLQQTLHQTDLPRLAACAAHRHVASQAGRKTVDMFLRYLCELEPVLPNDKEILIPGSWYDAGEKHLTADLYRTADLERARKAWKLERFYSQKELAFMEPDGTESAVQQPVPEQPSGFGLHSCSMGGNPGSGSPDAKQLHPGRTAGFSGSCRVGNGVLRIYARCPCPECGTVGSCRPGIGQG